MKEERLTERVDVAHGCLADLGVFRQDAAVKIDMHALEIDRGKTKQDQLQSDLGEANVAIEGLSTDFATTSVHLGHVTNRVDLAHEYFDGLGKGLQDMHRHSLGGTGSCGMVPLPPKSPQKGSTLPGISGRGAQALTHKLPGQI